MEEEVQVSKITPVMPARSFLGFAVDFALSFSCIMSASLFISPFLAESFGSTEAVASMKVLVEESHIGYFNTSEKAFFAYSYSKEESNVDDSMKIIVTHDAFDEKYLGLYPFEAYADILFTYFKTIYESSTFSLLGKDGTLLDKASYPSFSDYGKYVGETFFQISDSSESFYRFAINGETGVDYSLKPVLNEENETVKRLGDEKEVLASVSTLNRFFLSSNSTAAHNGVYGSAFESFFLYQPAYQKELRKANYALYWSQVIMRVSFPLIFFLIIPLCFRDGKSIGRRLARSAVIDKNGYSAKKMRIFLHQFPLYAFFLTGLIPFDIIYYGALFLLPCADFLVKLLSKDRRSAHEYIAGTLTVDDDESEYFSSKDEKDEFLASHMVGIRKSKPKKEEPVYEEIKENKPPVEENKEGKQAEEIVTKKPSGHGELDEDSFLDEQGE